MKLFYISLVFLAASIYISPVFSASYDCEKASTSVEHSVCDTPELSVMDSEMATLFRNILQHDPTIKINQRQWLSNTRNKCHNTECLSSAYKTRILQLSRISQKYALPDQSKEYSKPSAISTLSDSWKVQISVDEFDDTVDHKAISSNGLFGVTCRVHSDAEPETMLTFDPTGYDPKAGGLYVLYRVDDNKAIGTYLFYRFDSKNQSSYSPRKDWIPKDYDDILHQLITGSHIKAKISDLGREYVVRDDLNGSKASILKVLKLCDMPRYTRYMM